MSKYLSEDVIVFTQHLGRGIVNTISYKSSVIAATYLGDATVIFFNDGSSIDLRYPDETPEISEFLKPFMCSLEECIAKTKTSGSSNV